MAESNFEIISDEQKDKIQKLIVDGLQFAEGKEEFLCSNCQLVPIYNYVYPCNHPYCKDCFNFFVKSKRKCRKCNSACGFEKKQSKHLEMSIYNLKSICPNKKYGCSKQIDLKKLLIHLDECQFTRESAFPKIYDPDKDPSEQINRDIEALKKSVFETTQLNENLLKTVNENNAKLAENQKLFQESLRKAVELVKMNETLVEANRQLTEQCKTLVDSGNENNSKFKADFVKMQEDLENSQKTIVICKEKIIKLETVDSERLEENKKLKLEIAKQKEQMEAKLVKQESEINDKLKASVEKTTKLETDNSNRLKEFQQLKLELERQKEQMEAIVVKQESEIDIKLIEIDSIKGRMNKLENSRAIKDSVLKNPWNNLNFNDQEGIKSKMEEIISLKNGTVLWQIENYEKKRKEESTLFSEEFYSRENGFKMRIKIEFGYPFIYSSIEILPRELDRLLPPAIHFRATVSILDQSGRSQKRDRVMVYEPPFGRDAEEVLWNEYFFWLFLGETEEKGIYLKNDKILIKAEIEPITSLFRNYFSNDGILVWNIDNYERTKRESIKWINQDIFSDYFYSSESGFRMKARVGFDDDEDIYFRLLFLVGEFDSKLPSHFNHKCTITLIDQKQSIPSKDLVIYSEKLDSASVGEKKVRERMSDYCCHGKGISQSKVEKEPYLINDKIIVKFVVEAL